MLRNLIINLAKRLIRSTIIGFKEVGARAMFGEKTTVQALFYKSGRKFVTESGALPRDCIVTNISEGGARLFSEAANIPDQFRLLIDGDHGPLREECRVVWRLGASSE